MNSRWHDLWMDLATLRWLTGADGRISFTKLSVVALFIWILKAIRPEISWTFIALVVLLACIPFGLRGINTFVQYIANRGEGK